MEQVGQDVLGAPAERAGAQVVLGQLDIQPAGKAEPASADQLAGIGEGPIEVEDEDRRRYWSTSATGGVPERPRPAIMCRISSWLVEPVSR